jgi:hypothetical protein
VKKTVSVFHSDGTIFREEEPLPPGAAMHLYYYRTYLPKGKTEIDSALFINRYAYEQCLKRWNQLGGDTWQYTEEDPCPR